MTSRCHSGRFISPPQPGARPTSLWRTLVQDRQRQEPEAEIWPAAQADRGAAPWLRLKRGGHDRAGTALAGSAARCAVLAPHAPQRCSILAAGYQWWGLSGFAPAALAAGAASAAPAIDAFIDRKLEQYRLSEAELALVGFSQGTMMALHVGLRRPRAVAAVVGYSGMLTGAAELAHRDFAKPPVLLVHGSADPVVPVAALHIAESELKRLGVPVTTASD